MDRTQAVVIAALLVSACGSKEQRIVVGSKNFTEQVLLGEIIAQQIEQAGVKVDRKFNLGGTLLAHEALKSGSIDLYPEYTGTALTAVLNSAPDSKADVVLGRVRDAYAQQWKLEWLAPFGFNNTFAMVVRNTEGIRTLSDAEKSGKAWRIGVGYEFLSRADGLQALLKTYKLKLAGDPVTMDLGLLYKALETNKADMVAANSTDGLLSTLPVIALKDDRGYSLPYECAIVVRQETLNRMPQLRPALEKLSGSLTEETMRKLNYAVDGEHKPVPEVASSFLKSATAR